MVDTLRELREAQIEDEFALMREYKQAATRVIERHGQEHEWPEEDITMVKAMIGVDLPPSLGTTNWTGFNGKPRD